MKRNRVELKRSKARLEQRKVDLIAEAIKAHVKVQNLEKQLASYRRTLKDLEVLVEGERKDFRAGGSSLFMVNQREMRYIKARDGSIETKAKLEKALDRLKYRLGIF